MENQQYGSRSAILQIADIQYEEVDVPEWKCKVRVRSLTGSERDALEASMIVGEGKKSRVKLDNLRAKLVARTVVGEKGERLFTDADIDELSKKNASALNRIFTVAQRLSGIAEEDVEELTKNSEEG